MSSGGIFPRMLRAAKLEPHVYEEVESDSGATGQALLAVALVSCAGGIGHGISAAMKHSGNIAVVLGSLATGIIGALIVWFIYSLLCFWLGTTLFKGPETKSTLGELLRTLGFAYSPGLLNIFSFIPFIGSFIPFITWVWTVIASVIAIRQACDFSTGRAVGTAIIAAIIPLIIMILIAVLIGGALAALMGAAK